MEAFEKVFGMPLFPHLYAIPMSIMLGAAIGYVLRGKLEGSGSTAERLPPRPKV